MFKKINCQNTVTNLFRLDSAYDLSDKPQD